MAGDQQKQARPPYASVGDLEKFFARMGTIRDPGTVDTAWVTNYKVAEQQPEGIVTLLKWLRIVDGDGNSMGVWDEVRVAGTRKQKLEELVRAAYSGVFDAIDVAEADRDVLRDTFIQVYGHGDPGRYVTCFLALCKEAGIPVKAATPTRARGSENGKDKAPKPPTRRPTAGQVAKADKVRGNHDASSGIAVTITLNVEIPAGWSDEEIQARVAAVRRAAEAGDSANAS